MAMTAMRPPEASPSSVRTPDVSRATRSRCASNVVRRHLGFALEDREHLASWQQEFRTLPAEDAWRLRRMQRLYVEEWVQVVGEIRPDLSDAEARAAVHATLALLQSSTEYKSGLPSEALTPLLTSMALGALRGVNAEALPPPVASEAPQ